MIVFVFLLNDDVILNFLDEGVGDLQIFHWDKSQTPLLRPRHCGFFDRITVDKRPSVISVIVRASDANMLKIRQDE